MQPSTQTNAQVDRTSRAARTHTNTERQTGAILVVGLAHVALLGPGAVGEGLVEPREVREVRRVLGQGRNLLLQHCCVRVRVHVCVELTAIPLVQRGAHVQ